MTYVARNTPESINAPFGEAGQAVEHATQSEGKLFFGQLSPKSAFVVGLVMSFLTLCTIGFFILLNFYL